MPVGCWLREPRAAPGRGCKPRRTHLVTAGTAGLLAVTVMAATVQLPVLPEVNHVD